MLFLLFLNSFGRHLLFLLCPCLQGLNDQFEPEDSLSDDFYKLLPLDALYMEYRKVKKEKGEYARFMKESASVLKGEGKDSINAYVQQLDDRLAAMRHRIQSYYFKRYQVDFHSFGRGLRELMSRYMADPKGDEPKIRS